MTILSLRVFYPDTIDMKEGLALAQKNGLSYKKDHEAGISAASWGDIFHERDIYQSLVRIISINALADPKDIWIFDWLCDNLETGNDTWDNFEKAFLSDKESYSNSVNRDEYTLKNLYWGLHPEVQRHLRLQMGVPPWLV